ncbi:MAG: serine/threonine protein kinase [Deltaproteobacteria bacterium]|nr:serine/threonine protein kinase [Deltaproteobacteria bacterium]
MSRPQPARQGEDSSTEDLVGKIISGKYLVLGRLGTGGMGTIYDCENVAVGRKVALKVLNPLHKARAEAVGRFEREARAAARIGHPNIIDVLDLGRTDDGVPYIVMERLSGEDLFALLDRSGPLQPALAIDIIGQVLGALGAAHAAGIVHRDLKPDNVFLARRGPRADFVKVLDFGVAKFHDAALGETRRLTRDGSVLGTPSYMSPEQAAGSRDIDARSDLYSVGALLYEMLSGTLAYEGENYNEVIAAIITREPRPLREVAPWVTEGLAAVISRAMARDPNARFQTAAELQAALEPYSDVMELEVPDAAGSSGRWSPGQKASMPTMDLPGEPAPGAPGTPSSSMIRAIPVVDQMVVGEEAAEDIDRGGRRRVAFVAIGAVSVLAIGLGALLLTRADEGPSDARADEPGGRGSVAPPAAQSISVEVESNAVGARVLLDGRALGVTPLHRPVPRADGDHVLRLEAAGFESTERSIPLASDLHLVIDLRRSEAPPPAAPPPAAPSPPASLDKGPARPGRGRPAGRPLEVPGGGRPPAKRLIFDDNVYQ